MSPWIHVTRPYNGGELVYMVHRVNGKHATHFVNQWGEVSVPMWNGTIAALVAAMRAEVNKV